MILEIILVLVAAVGLGLAFYKHGSLSAVKASAVKEAENLEALASKDAAAKADYDAIVARLKALGL